MRKLAVLVAAVVLAIMSPKGAWAEVEDESQNSVTVGPTAAGPVVRQGSAGFDSGGIQANAASQEQQSAAPQPAARSAPTPASGPSAATPISLTAATSTPPCGTPQQGATYSPTTDAAGQPLILTGGISFTVCGQAAPPPQPLALGPNPTPQQLAEEASANQPWPNLVVSVNPGTGLTGLASWFWLGGGSPQIPDATASAGGLTVKVRASLVDVHWEFGDGSNYDSGTDLGQAYPAQSDVSHVYQTDGNDQVSVSLVFSVEYAVGDGPWQPLGTKSRAYTRPYSINQLQPQAVGT